MNNRGAHCSHSPSCSSHPARVWVPAGAPVTRPARSHLLGPAHNSDLSWATRSPSGAQGTPNWQPAVGIETWDDPVARTALPSSLQVYTSACYAALRIKLFRTFI